MTSAPQASATWRPDPTKPATGGWGPAWSVTAADGTHLGWFRRLPRPTRQERWMAYTATGDEAGICATRADVAQRLASHAAPTRHP